MAAIDTNSQEGPPLTAFKEVQELAGAAMAKLQLYYALTLMAVFLLTAVVYSIKTAKVEEGAVTPTVKGPGGRPLPANKKKGQQLGSSSGTDWNKELHLPTITPKAKGIFRLLSIAIFSTFVINGVAIGLHAFEANDNDTPGPLTWFPGDPTIVYLLGGACVHLYFIVSLFEWKNSPSLPHIVTWVLCFFAELAMFMQVFLSATSCPNLQFSQSRRLGQCLDGWMEIELGLSLSRVILVLGECALYSLLWLKNCPIPANKEDVCRDNASHHSDSGSDEETPLLSGGGQNYSTLRRPTQHTRSLSHAATLANCAETTHSCSKDEQTAFYRPEKLPNRNWWEYLRTYKIFWPYVWPKPPRLKFRVYVCFLLTLLQRGVNIYLPLKTGQLTDKIAHAHGDGQIGMSSLIMDMPWGLLWLVNLLMLVQGNSGLLGSLRTMIWNKVSQHSYKHLQTEAFKHVHSLSLDFHLGKRTGEITSALNKGGSINTFLEQITFSLIPMIVDLVVAVYFFSSYFDSTYGAIVSVNIFWYLYLTVKMARARADQRREMSNADREEDAVKIDSLMCYETVKYFNAEQFEFARYGKAVDAFQRAEAQVNYGTNLMTIAQVTVFTTGQAVALIIGAFQVWNGQRGVGDFVTLMAYLQQMQAPLNFFSQFYRVIQQSLISGERLLTLFKYLPSVTDSDEAKPLKRCEGKISWKNVRFAYNNKSPAFKNLSFECAPGTTTAFVGESGGGKSTVFRLMYRFYNCDEGSIEIDDQDVKNLSIESVRKFIGVVPQETIMFNETILYNLKYSRPGCTDDEVHEACKAASIHDRIMEFPQGYMTMVGERGTRLSGGEKQRVAIARAILKNPRIIMLDEATSALDTETEQSIQEGVNNVCQGRTVLMIAHRLSTITHADQIIVLKQGEIVERGTHEELIKNHGLYASMWEKQAQATREAHLSRKRLAHNSADDDFYMDDATPMSDDNMSDGESSNRTLHDDQQHDHDLEHSKVDEEHSTRSGST